MHHNYFHKSNWISNFSHPKKKLHSKKFLFIIFCCFLIVFEQFLPSKTILYSKVMHHLNSADYNLCTTRILQPTSEKNKTKFWTKFGKKSMSDSEGESSSQAEGPMTDAFIEWSGPNGEKLPQGEWIPQRFSECFAKGRHAIQTEQTCDSIDPTCDSLPSNMRFAAHFSN